MCFVEKFFGVLVKHHGIPGGREEAITSLTRVTQGVDHPRVFMTLSVMESLGGGLALLPLLIWLSCL